jgi:hypothetical protein
MRRWLVGTLLAMMIDALEGEFVHGKGLFGQGKAIVRSRSN